ncbi:FUSC family protein [Acidothermaceae bacterium B102]|nr:FUSC family protein [Acidothermaceae bacterium B102]
MHPLQWLAQHDRNYLALRRAARTAIIMPAMFAFGDKVLDNPVLATFAAFGTFAMLLLVDFAGPVRQRLQAQAALGVAGCVLVVLGTLVSQSEVLSVVAMAVVAFAVIFAGVVSSTLAGATTSMLLAFILPVSLPGHLSSIPDRVGGWALAAVVAFVAIGVLWPVPARDPLRGAASAACKAIAARLRAEVAFRLSDGEEVFAHDLERAAAEAATKVAALHQTFLATPYRPTGLSTATRTVVRLVDELSWLDAIVVQSSPPIAGHANHEACAVKVSAAETLEQGAALLDVLGGDSAALHEAMSRLADALTAMEQSATIQLPVSQVVPDGDDQVTEFISSLDPSFRAQELCFAVSLVAGNIDLTAAAERRSWLERLLGRQPEGLSSRLSAASERATSHVERHSVWLHNSIRGGAALGLSVLLADETGVQHSFWVILGTLSVLRSNALNTGQNIVRGLAGTVAGFVIGALLLEVIGTNPTTLWVLLPLAILVAGVAPAAISFAAGQAAFTVVLVILFNIIQPAGWRIGLLRVEDIALGCSVSLVVGLLFWPRGARAALRQALAEAYVDSAAYLARAVEYGMVRCDWSAAPPIPPTAEALKAADAARRLDDTFRNFLAEGGAKPLPLAQVTSLVTGVAGVRLAADAVLDLWQRDDGVAVGDRAVARAELLRSVDLVQGWFDDLAGSLLDERELRPPLPHDKVADGRLVDAVRHDLQGDDGKATATAVRMIWTGDHLDAVRRLQQVVVGPARQASEIRVAGARGALRDLVPHLPGSR